MGPSIAELLGGAHDIYRRAERSPDGRYAIVVAQWEMRMSHWVDTASLHTLPDERLVTQFGGSLWSADRISWAPGGESVTVELRRYPGDVPGVSVQVDLVRGVARVDAGAEMPLSRLSDELEADYHRRGGRE